MLCDPVVMPGLGPGIHVLRHRNSGLPEVRIMR